MKIEQIKQTINNYNFPSFWVTDWLLYVINQPTSFLITDGNYQLTADEQAKFNQGVVQMQAGKPLAYLIGKQAFWSLDFIVNEHTLIPRPDTELLVETVLDWIKQNQIENHAHLLDLGTGSGCVAISLKYELAKLLNTNWLVTATDISEEALAVAKQNTLLNKVHVELLQSSWYDNLTNTVKFDVIVSNPPYINKTDEHLLALKAEPITALVSDNQGLADIEQIVGQASSYLKLGGLLAIEHGYDQGQVVTDIFKLNRFKQVKCIKDYGGNDRITIGVLS